MSTRPSALMAEAQKITPYLDIRSFSTPRQNVLKRHEAPVSEARCCRQELARYLPISPSARPVVSFPGETGDDAKYLLLD
jgi:hypothetical protein